MGRKELPELRNSNFVVNTLHTTLSKYDIITVQLQVRKDNPAAYHLYSKMGYEQIEDRGEKYLMQLDLRKL